MMGKLFLFFITLLGMVSCSSVVYQPTRVLYSSPKNFDLDFKEVVITTKDKTKIYGWYIPTTLKKRKGLVLQFHGNAQNMSAHFLSLVWLVKKGYDVFTFDYRGYGLSEGKPTQKGLRDDGKSVIKFVAQEHLKGTNDKFIIYGQSLGGIVLFDSLLHLEKKAIDRIDLVVLESSFSSYQRIAFDKLVSNPLTFLFSPLAFFLMNDTTATRNYLGTLRYPKLLVIHSKTDKIVPYKFGQEIFKKYTGEKDFWKLDDVPHIGMYYGKHEKLREILLKKFEE